MFPNSSTSTRLWSAIVACGPAWARARALSNASPGFSTHPPVKAVATRSAGSTRAARHVASMSATAALAAVMFPVA